MRNIREIPIPPRMAHLPKDPRGYPIPAMVLIDDGGRPHFQINDERLRQGCIKADNCVICGRKLFRGRWFVGGPLSAFSERGLYIDPPLHKECMEYAMAVCPYLAAPNYGKEIGTKTLKGRTTSGVGIKVDPTTIAERPDWFVAVMAVGQDYKFATGDFAAFGYDAKDVRYVRHHVGSAREIQIWRHGQRVTDPAAVEDFCRNTVRRLLAEYGEAGRADMWQLVRPLMKESA